MRTKQLIKGVAVAAVGALMTLSVQAAEFTGAGATFPFPIYSKWAEAYKASTGIGLNYQSIGSGGGMRQIKAKTVDFGASDQPMKLEELEKEGISAEVIDLRTIRPLDWYTILESVKKTNRLVIVEEQWPFASISSEITYRIQKEGFDYLDAPIRRITAADAPMHYAPNLVAAYLPDVSRTVKLVKEVMYMNK